MHTFIQFNTHTCERGACPLSKLKRYFIDRAKNERNCVDLQLRGTMFSEPLHCIFFATTISIKVMQNLDQELCIYPIQNWPILYFKNWKFVQWSKKFSKKNFCMQLAIKTTLMSGQDVLRLLTSQKTRREQNQQQWSSQIKMAKRVSSAFSPAAALVAARQKNV